jgi:TonB family protein
MKCLLLQNVFLAVVCSVPVVAQNKNDIVAYFDAAWRETKHKPSAAYYRKIEGGPGHYLVKDYYASNDSLQMKGWFSSIKPVLVQDGEAIWYRKDGSVERMGSYKANKPVGLHKSFYENGSPQEEMIYRGEEDPLRVQYWDKDGKPFLTNGTGLVIERIERLELDSYTEVVDSVAICSYTVHPASLDTVFTMTQEPPTYRGGLKTFYGNVQSLMVYPREARRAGIDGKVFVEFIVDKNGRMTDARVVKGIGGGCDEVALAACSNQHDWIPATHKGKPVKTRMVLPITFRLGR